MNENFISVWPITDLYHPHAVQFMAHRLRMIKMLYGTASILINEDEGTITIAPPGTDAPAAPPAEKKSALDEAKDQAEDRPGTGGAKPPEDGPCRECKRHRRLNRLRLCYPCFAELVLAEECKKRGVEWKPGDPHPAWCGCEGLGEHADRDHGAWRGN